MTRGMGKWKSEFDLKGSRLAVGAGRERECVWSEDWTEVKGSVLNLIFFYMEAVKFQLLVPSFLQPCM